MGTEESELQNLPAEESHMNHIQEAWKVRLHGYLKLRERERERDPPDLVARDEYLSKGHCSAKQTLVTKFFKLQDKS